MYGVMRLRLIGANSPFVIHVCELHICSVLHTVHINEYHLLTTYLLLNIKTTVHVLAKIESSMRDDATVFQMSGDHARLTRQASS